MSIPPEPIAPALRVRFLPRARPLDLRHLGIARRMMNWAGLLARFNLPRPACPVRVEQRRLRSADGQAELELRLHRPAGLAAGSGAMLWTHGGGYVMGSAKADDGLCALYAAAAGLLVVAVDYRLAPEHPYPLPLEDCYSALCWLHEQAGALGIDAARIAIGGASAGGGLTAALALLARDRGGPRPAFQLLNYPMLDDRTDVAVHAYQGEWVWGAASNRSGWSAYLGGTPAGLARVPGRADVLAGLPPAWLGCGTLDLFHPECEAYAQRLRAAGVACTWHSVPGGYHGFDTAAPRAPASRDYFDDQIRTLRSALAPGDSTHPGLLF